MPAQNGKRKYSQTQTMSDQEKHDERAANDDRIPKDAVETEQWKYRAPYRVHTNDDFKPIYEAGCHCGKVKYQLAREAPLDSKLCHCTTCQTQHGVSAIVINACNYGARVC